MAHSRLQSAMEYLMTYGWAILIIAVVLGVLYQLGIFGNSTSLLQSSCLATTGYFCANPILNTSGYLGIKFGEIGLGTITIKSVGCSANVSAPVTTQTMNAQLNSGGKTVLQFSCPLQSQKIGSGFKGYLWITYDTKYQSGIVDRFAVVIATASTMGNVTSILGGQGALVNIPNYIYCVGGSTSGNINNVYYAPLSSGGVGSWTPTTNYPLSVSSQSCGVYGGYVYCIGGSGGGSGFFANVYYAPVSGSGIGTWATSTGYPLSLRMHSCVFNGGYVYCIGGNADGIGNENNVYYAALSSGGVGTWTATNSYPLSLQSQSCVTSGGYVYCLGGNTGSNINNVYYATVSSGGVGTWASSTVYPLSLSSQSCGVYSGYIYCIGGSGGGTGFFTNVYYAPVSSGGIGTWASSTSYPLSVRMHSCVFNGGYVYCIGGNADGIGNENNVYYAALSSGGVGTWTATNSYPLSLQSQSCVNN